MLVWPHYITSTFLDILASKQNRETGLIESGEHLTLLLIIIQLINRIKKSEHIKTGYKLSIALAFIGFVLLEETDYFMQYTELLLHRTPYSISVNGFRNLHHAEVTFSLSKLFFAACSLLTTIIFIRTFIARKLTNSPFAWIALGNIILTQVAFTFLQLLEFNHLEGARQLISETREWGVYLTWLFWALQNHLFVGGNNIVLADGGYLHKPI